MAGSDNDSLIFLSTHVHNFFSREKKREHIAEHKNMGQRRAEEKPIKPWHARGDRESSQATMAVQLCIKGMALSNFRPCFRNAALVNEHHDDDEEDDDIDDRGVVNELAWF